MKNVRKKANIENVYWIQKRIITLIKSIKNEKFLGRILMSLIDYLKENPE